MATSRSKVKVARSTILSKVVVKVKVFFDRQTGQKLDAHRIGDSGGIKKDNNLHHMQDRVILIGSVYSCEIGKGCIKFQYNASVVTEITL